MLQEVVDLLHPFAEATDLTQGENILTISAVIPTILSLRILLRQMSTSVRFHAAAVQELLNQLHERFFHVLTRINVELPPTACTSRTLAFDSDVFMLASAIDLLSGMDSAGCKIIQAQQMSKMVCAIGLQVEFMTSLTY